MGLSKNRVLTEYILHRGDLGNGEEGVALIWMDSHCPIPRTSKVSLRQEGNRDLFIHDGDQFRLTLKSVAVECFEIVRQKQRLYVIYQPENSAPQSFYLATTTD